MVRRMRQYFCEACSDKGCQHCNQLAQSRLAPALAAVGDPTEQANQALQTVELARTVPCTSAEEYVQCAKFLKQAQGQMSHYEAVRKRLGKPFLDTKREIDGWFKPITKAMSEVKQVLAGKLKAYDQRIEAERRAALAAVEQAHQQQNQPALDRAAAALAPPLPTVKGVHTRKRWTYRVVALNAVPRGFLMINDQAIRNAIKSGTREVPGLAI